MMAEQLKPCPHCAGPAFEEALYDGCPGWTIGCDACGIQLWRGMSMGEGPAIAREHWNRRTPSPATAAMLDIAKNLASAFEDHAGTAFKAAIMMTVDELQAFLAEWAEPDAKGGA